MSHIEDSLLSMTRYGQAIHRAGFGVLGEEDLVSNASFATLVLLYRDGPQRPTQIAELTGLTSGGATKLITRLENAGLVVRETGAVSTDGRAVVVSLTVFGTKKTAEVVEAATEHVHAMVDALVAIRSNA